MPLLVNEILLSRVPPDVVARCRRRGHGKRRWHGLRAAIDRFRGREVTSTGDGFLALFDGASRAVRAAALMDRAVAEHGIRVRVGLHTIEIVGGQPRGVGVHAAARVAALAGLGEVLLSGTTRDLLDGSGLSSSPAASTSSRV